MSRSDRLHAVLRPFSVAALLAVASLGSPALAIPAQAAPAQARAGQATKPAPTPSSGEAVKPPAAWTEIDQLVADDKLAEALKAVEARLAAAEKTRDGKEWTRALIRRTQLQTALGTFEVAVRELAAAAKPAAPLHRSVLDLFYGQSLVNYLDSYRWQIAQRERVETTGELDLAHATQEQIFAAAQQPYLAVWQARERWGSESIGTLAEHIEPNNYPPRIRGTLRDAVTYLWVELLADSSNWRPEQSEAIYQLDLDRLLAGSPLPEKSEAAVALVDPRVHPLAKIAFLLADLEAWHQAHGRPEAAFEARLERLRQLTAWFSQPDDRQRLRRDLEGHLAKLDRGLEWWSMGQAELADLVRQEVAPDSLVRARAIALAGATAHPKSAGGKRSRAIVDDIEAPQYSVQSMQSDGPGRRSIRVEHRNLPTLYFRAFRLDLASRLDSPSGEVFPGWQEVEQLYRRGKPDLAWQASLPPTPDYRDHASYVTPPLTQPGLYVVQTSTRQSFADAGNQLYGFSLVISDLVLVSRDLTSGYEVSVRQGTTGELLPGVAVDAYPMRARGPAIARGLVTDAEGRVQLPPLESGNPYLLVARRGEQMVVTPAYASWRSPVDEERKVSLVYTDRSIYRPSQKLYWKTVAFRRVNDERYRAEEGATLTVELADSQGETVASAAVTTNRFGSASGSFEIPAGRLLGDWAVRTSLGGRAEVKVEEYKRPTFEVTVEDPKSPLRLNREATLGGAARYYFGLPVSAGEVSWRVTREPVWVRWDFWGFKPAVSNQIVAAGAAKLDADGKFAVTFTPAADEREAKTPGLSYRFRLSADVTDEGGETRSDSRAFRLGFVAVEASLDAGGAFVRADEKRVVEVRRQDLDGTGRAGDGSWRLVALRQPAEARLPADQPLPADPTADPAAYHTAGDALRPRWDTALPPQAILAAWPEGEAVGSGELHHGADGLAELALPPLAAGAYRLHYQTEDGLGGRFETQQDLLVAAPGGRLALPLVLLAEQSSVAVGGTARLLLHSGLPHQTLELEIYRNGERRERRRVESGEGMTVLELPVTERDRGGFRVVASGLADYQWLGASVEIFVPWDDRKLTLELASFRDRLRPGSHETWTVTVKGGDDAAVAAGSAELLAYMYDRSLDLFAAHVPPDPLAWLPRYTGSAPMRTSLGVTYASWSRQGEGGAANEVEALHGDRLRFFDGYGIGGPGNRYFRGRMLKGGVEGGVAGGMAGGDPAPQAMAIAEVPRMEMVTKRETDDDFAPPAPPPPPPPGQPEAPEAAPAVRSDFAETAFWQPHLVTGEGGAVSFEFTVPDSVTEWNVWLHALTADLRAGSLTRRTASVKELMVRPYLPRFLREGDRAEIRVAVNNASKGELSGTVDLDILDPETEQSLLGEFGLDAKQASGRSFTVAAGGGTTLAFPIAVPARVGTVAFKVVARAGAESDGELRPLPVLPGRMHLVQSRFVTLKDADAKTLRFDDLAADGDPTRIDEQLVVTLDAQLFYSALSALPYLVAYPYECTEQTMNRFLSSSILTSVFSHYPAVADMARQLASRDTQYESWNAPDANRKMTLEETPWLLDARGQGENDQLALIKLLDPQVAAANQATSLAKLQLAQSPSGGFPWWPGGPDSPYMTLYLVLELSRALEFGIPVPQEMVARAWQYLHGYYVDELFDKAKKDNCCFELVTFLNFALSSYPGEEWTGGLFDDGDRKAMLDFSFRHWREHSPLLKGYLTLTLHRAGRDADARKVWDSVMDSAKTSPELGTYWAPEDRSWLWYNDTIESHAFALRVLTELSPKDPRRDGLVQWLLLNKKLNHWKSTRATAEVIYSLVHYLQAEGTLAARESATVTIGPRRETFTFEPDRYTGKHNQIVVPGPEIDPKTMATITVEKTTPGFLFASATWHFSTEKLPATEQGDLFTVSRRFFKRVQQGDEWVLQPLAEGARLATGDQVEVQLTLRAQHEAELVHLRDPRGAGFEPETMTSGYHWGAGAGWYEEVRDSGTNFFFDWLPAGEITLKYRLRANVAGTFKIAPAALQSMYAPEFNAYSTGTTIAIQGEAVP